MDLEALVGPVLEAAGLELVEVTYREGRRSLLRVTVDRPHGAVDLDTIADVSDRLSRRLDVEGFGRGAYTLEVTSPGVERPLRGPVDFARRIGESVRIRTGGRDESTLEGTITAVGDDGVTVATDQGQRSVAYVDITAARTVHDWRKDLKKR